MPAVFAVIGLVVIYLAKLWQDRVTPFDDDCEITERSNTAVALRRVGLYLAIAFALAGATYSGGSAAARLKEFAIDAAVALLLLVTAGLINNHLMLKGIDNNAEIGRGNRAVGLVELGSYIATGLILWASFTGEGGGILSAIVFTLLGQVALVAMFWIYEWLTPFNVVAQVNDNNAAAGLAVTGKLTALGVILAASIVGDFRGWTIDLISFGISAVIGIVLLLLLEKISDWLFLPRTTVTEEVERDRNVAAIALSQGIELAVAILVAASL